MEESKKAALIGKYSGKKVFVMLRRETEQFAGNGRVTSVDDDGMLLGTWGDSIKINPDVDYIEFL